MKHCHTAVALGASLVLCACSGLQQAPLLYSSKSIVGVDVSTPSSESPGASISIGFKLVDIAYVPVAVSKPFQDGSGKDLPSDIVRIEANFGEGSSAGQIDKLSEEELDKVGELLKAKARERSAERALGTVEANRKKKLEGQRAHELAKADSKTKASSQEIEAQSKQIADDLITLDRSLKTRREAFRQSQIDSAEAAAGVELGNLLRTDKRDAMSVYGRFDSAGGASAASSPSANLTAGKIFSTGVASQNLTEAARLQAATGGLAACLDSLTNMLRALPEDDRKAALEKFSGACAVRSGTAK